MCLINDGLYNYRGKQILLMNSEVGDSLVVKHTSSFLETLPISVGESSAEHVDWERKKGRVHITHNKEIHQFCWHCKGDYIAAVTADGKAGASYDWLMVCS